MQKTMNLRTEQMTEQAVECGAPEHRLWASVIMLLVDDAKNVKKAMLRYYEALNVIKHEKDFFLSVKAQEKYRCLESWELDRERIINEAASDWFQEMCSFVNLCPRRIRNEVMKMACVDDKILAEMRFWREQFHQAIKEREDSENLYKVKKPRKKKKKEYRPYV